MNDILTIRQVANGWIIQPGANGPNEFTHVAVKPEEVAEHVRRWTQAQTVVGPVK